MAFIDKINHIFSEHYNILKVKRIDSFNSTLLLPVRGHSGTEAGVCVVWALVIVGKASDIKLQKLFCFGTSVSVSECRKPWEHSGCTLRGISPIHKSERTGF